MAFQALETLILASAIATPHIARMAIDSKIFVGLRSTRKNSGVPAEPAGPKCQWDGCENHATQRAPVGRDANGLYFLFCLQHVRAYKGYNYSADLSSPEIARYQKEAARGDRKTWGTPVNEAAEIPMPSTARSGSAKALNARKSANQRQTEKRDPGMRRLKALEARAFQTLGLSPGATPQQITTRYKEKLRLHHPDANEGSRSSEEALRAAIEAHKILKLNGFC